MPLFYVKIRKNIDICNYLPIYYPAICRGWGTFSVPSPLDESVGLAAHNHAVGLVVLALLRIQVAGSHEEDYNQ